MLESADVCALTVLDGREPVRIYVRALGQTERRHFAVFGDYVDDHTLISAGSFERHANALALSLGAMLGCPVDLSGDLSEQLGREIEAQSFEVQMHPGDDLPGWAPVASGTKATVEA